MDKSVEMLLKKMGEDKTFAEKILSQAEREKVIEIAKGEGIELTMEGIDEVNEIIAKVLQSKNEGELSEEDLEKVAGGSDLLVTAISFTATSVLTVSTSVLTVSTAVSLVSTSASLISASASISAVVSVGTMLTAKK